MNRVYILDEAMFEINAVPERESVALRSAIEKLEIFGQNLGHPHSSQIKGTQLRELRPRAGRSPWRVFYKQMGQALFIVAAIGPEAMHDPRKFRRAIAEAELRLDRLGDIK